MQNNTTKSLHLLKNKGKVFLFFLFSFFLTSQLSAADFHWVGATGNWSDFATHWATTSGGAIFHTNAPTAADNVFFDASSGAANYTVTVDVVAVANNLTFSGNAFSFNGANSLTINGISTNSSTQIIDFGGANTYSFVGNFIAGTTTTTNFSNANSSSFGNVIVDAGATFRFSSTAGGNATVTGTFTPNGNCTNPVTLSATGASTAPVNFTNPQTWSGVHVSQINSTGDFVTVNSISVVVTGKFIDNTITGRTLFWVGGTGNWSEPAHWSLSSGGTGGECIPTGIDDTNFDAGSFSIAGQTLTIDIDGTCKDMDWTGVTNTPTLAGAAVREFTLTGSLTFAAAMNQTGNAPTFEGKINFSTSIAQDIMTFGKGLNRVQFQTAAAGSWTFQDAFLVINETLLISGELDTNSEDFTSGTLSVNTVLNPNRILLLGTSAITLTTASTTVLDLRGNDANFTLNSGTSTITINGANAVVETGIFAKTISNINFVGAGTRTINTGSDVNTITFQNITVSDNDIFTINGTSPKIYDAITVGNNVTTTINGVASDLGNTVNNNIVIGTGGTTAFNGGYTIAGNVTTGVGNILDFGATAGNNNFGGTVTIGDNGAFSAGGAKNNTFVGDFTLGTTATATLSNIAVGSTNSFSNINMNEGTIFRFNSGATALSTVSGNINVLGSCTTPITLTSNNPPTQARLQLATALDLVGATVQNINATAQPINVSSGTVANNTNVTGTTVSRDLFWVHSVAGAGSTGLWYDAANWSATSGGIGGECPPTIYDNVNFDANSFSAANQIVDMDADALCRSMDWTGVTNTPLLQSIGEDTDLTVGGNLTFVAGMTVGTGGVSPNEIRDIYFAATNAIPSAVATTNNTIDWGIPNQTTDGKRFKNAFFNQNKEMAVAGTTTWKLLSAFNLTQEATFGRLTLQNGAIATNSNPIEIGILDANGANGSLDIGDSEITLRATGLTFDFRNDTNFNFITPSANSFFSLTSTGGNVEGFTGSEAKEMPDIIVPQNTNVTINTDNGTNELTFRNIDLQNTNVTFNLTGTSQKTYLENLVFNDGIIASIDGATTTGNRNTFEGSITFGLNSQANFIGEDWFEDTFTVAGTTGTGIRFTGTGRKRFQADVSLGVGTLFSLQNTSAAPNSFTNVALANSTTFEFSPNTNNNVTGNFVAIADCITPIIIRSSTTGVQATVDFNFAQTWENVIVTDINNIGTLATVLSGTDGGNNAGIDFSTIIIRTLYWVHNGNPVAATGAGTIVGSTANWNDPNNWSLASGGQTGECIPTLSDDVLFDANSFGAATQVVNIDVNAQTRDMTWTGATGTPILQGTNAFNLQMGGSVTFIPAMNITFLGESIFRNTNTGTNTITSATQSFKGNTTFWDNTLGTGIWQLADNFETTQTFNLVDGTFTTTALNHQFTAQIIDVFTIANTVADPTRELNLNSSISNATLNGGLAVDFRGNTTNFVLSSTATSELHITGIGNIDLEMGGAAKTIPNLFIDNTIAGNTINVNSSNIENNTNRITFRDITALQNDLIFNINGQAPKTYGNITFPNNALVDFNGVDNAVPLLNLYTGTVDFGTNTQIDWFGDNQFQQLVTIASTANVGNAVRLFEDNEFLVTAPLTFTVAGRARFTAGGGNRTNIFRAPVNFFGGQNVISFIGGASTIARFTSTLFVASTATQQAFIDFRSRPEFHAQVEFGEAAGGNATTQVRFRRGINFAPAPAGTKFITGNDSRIEFLDPDVSVIRDMDVGENNVLTFNNDLTIDNLNLTRFDVVNFPNSDLVTPAANSGRTTITGFLRARNLLCSDWINIRSNLTTIGAEIDFENDHLDAANTSLVYTFIQDIHNIGGTTVEASPNPIVNVSNNVGISFIGTTVGTTYYWVANGVGNHSGNWNDLNGVLPTEQLNHWSYTSGGTPTGCLPTPSDNVIFDELSFGSSNDIVTLDNFFSYCKDMIWEDDIFTVSGFRPRLRGDNLHILQIFGDLRFPNFPTRLNWNEFRGLTEFKGTSTPETKTIESNNSRFNGPVEFDSPADTWILLDSMRINGFGGGDLTINYGELISNNQNIRLDDDWTINTPTGTLPQGHFIAGTGTVTFYGTGGQVSDITINDFQTGAACSECTDPVLLAGCSGSPFYNLTIEKGHNRRTELSTTVSIYNNFHIVGGTFEDDGNQVRGNTTGTVYMYDNTLLRLGVNNRATTFPTCYPRANITLSDGTLDGFANNIYTPENGSTKASIVEYRCPDDQLIRGLTYGTLYLRSDGGGNNTKRFTGSATINGDFFINDNQRIRDMGFQITGNDFATGNRFRMDNNAAIYIGTNENVGQNTYPVSGFEPDGMIFPPINTEFAATYGATNIVADNIATVFPKFTNAGELDDLATGGKMDLRNTSYVIYNAGAAQEIAAGFTYSTIRLRATGLATIIPKTIVRHNLISDAEMRVGRELRIEEFNSLIDDGNQIVGVGTPNLEAQADTKLILGNQTVATLFPTVFVRANIDLDANDHETIYNSDVNQFMSNEPIYGNVTLTAPNSINATLIEKRFRPDPVGTNAGLTADINGNLIINPRNHLIDEGNQITGLAPKSVTMFSDAPLGESMLTLGTNTPSDIATEFPLTFGTVILNDLTTVIYNAGGAGLNQPVRGAGLNGIETGTDSYYNLIIQSNNEFTGIKTLQDPTRIRNNFTIRTGNRFEDNQNQVTGSTTTAAGMLTMEDGATLYVGLNNGGVPTVFPTNYERARIILDNNSTVRYQSRRGGIGQFVSSEPIYGNLLLTSGLGVAGANFTKQIAENPVLATNTTLTVTRDLTVDYRVRFEDLGVQIIGNSTNNLLVEDGSELVLGTGTRATLFPTLFTRGNTDLSALDAIKSIVIYNSSIAGNDIAGGAGVATTEINNPIYGDIILRSPTNAAVTKNLLGNVVIKGDLLIEDNNTLETTGSNFNINLAGNWTCESNAIFNSQLGRVILDGTGLQEVTTNAQKFFQLQADNTSGSLNGIRMLDNITIKTGGQTIFNTGLFYPNVATIKMIFEENATVGGSGSYTAGSWVSISAPALTPNGPSNMSHVVGKVEKQGRDAFMFPIGNGVNYAPAGLGARANSSAIFEAHYIGPRFPDTDGYFTAQKEPLIQVVSHLEYWIINKLSAPVDPAFVYLSWDNPRSAAYQPEGLLVLRWEGAPFAATGIWQDRNKGGYSNASNKGVIVSFAPVSDFSPFTLGSFTNFNPLPLDLLSFDAKIEGESVKVTWETTNEQDNSHFNVERSQDATSFGSLGRINAKGTGLEGTFNYQFWDAEPYDGLSYYRLQMFDVDGTFKYSPVKSVLFEKIISGIKGEISLYPNPNGGARFYLNLEGKLKTDAQVEIMDMVGRVVHKQDIQKGAADIIVTPMRVLPTGTYILRFVTPQESITKKFVVE